MSRTMCVTSDYPCTDDSKSELTVPTGNKMIKKLRKTVYRKLKQNIFAGYAQFEK